MSYLFLCIFTLSFVLSALATALARRLAAHIDWTDNPRGSTRKKQKLPVPYGGGLAIFSTLAIVLTSACITISCAASCQWTPSFIPAIFTEQWHTVLTLAESIAHTDVLKKGLFFGAGAAGIFILGTYDDVKPLSARAKLFWQALLVILPIYGGFRVTFTHDISRHVGLFGNSINEPLAWLISGLWIILIINAFNLLDNMDGLCGGLAVETALFLSAIAFENNQLLICGMLMTIGGSTLGFLIHNFPKAKVYIGDGGALFLGYIFGTLSIGTHFFTDKGTFLSIIAPLCALAVPLYDTTSVLYIRMETHRPLFEGDQNHLSHRLVRLGLSPAESVVTIWLISAVTCGLAFLITRVDRREALLIFALTLAILTLIWILETAARKNTP